jgi:hypothetical protein
MEPCRPFDTVVRFEGIQSEAAIKSALTSCVFNRVSFVLKWLGLSGKWREESTARASRGRAKMQRSQLPVGTLTVKGMMYKKPDYELFDANGRVRSFEEVKFP